MSDSRRHELRCWTTEFAAVLDGRKRFEYRKDDRDFAIGDELILEEFRPGQCLDNGEWFDRGYTGRRTLVTVIYLLRGRFGVPDGYVVLGISEPRSLESVE